MTSRSRLELAKYRDRHPTHKIFIKVKPPMYDEMLGKFRLELIGFETLADAFHWIDLHPDWIVVRRLKVTV